MKKTALVTGGSHGIGLSIAKKFHLNGIKVALLSRDAEKLERAKGEMDPNSEDILLLKADVLRDSEVEEAWSRVESQWGGVDILVNNVGGGGRWGSPKALETSSDVWTEVYKKNTGVAIELTMRALPHMVERGWGRVITITSIHSHFLQGRPWFDIAKVGQRALMKSLASEKEFARAGITFNAIAPGAIDIPDTGWDYMKQNDPESYQNFVERLPLGRLGTPEEVANLVFFIASGDSSLLNGASIVIDGGETSELR